MMRVIEFIIVLVLFATMGCEIFEDPGVMCSDEYVYGVRADIQCRDTLEAAELSGAVQLTATGYKETLDVLPAAEAGRFVAYGAGERAGTYKLSVQLTGYREWTQEDIVVSEDVCHVDQVNVTVRLVKE